MAPPEELRLEYRRHLEEINGQVIQLFALVGEGLAAATDALLSGDRDMARALMESDDLVDKLYHDVEGLVFHELALQAPLARDLRFLLSVLRVVPELERSHDLVEHIARRGIRGLREELTPRTRGLIEQMGSLGVEMWRAVADAWFERDPDAYNRLNARDDEMDDLHANLTAELASGTTSLPVAMDMALVARFYERLGDHAVNIAHRVRFLAGMEP
jgi:phosphate transport system protein